MALSGYSQGLLGVLFLLLVSHPPTPPALGYDYVEHSLSGERSVEDWPLLFWRKKVGFFHHGATHGHLVVERAPPGGTCENENHGGIGSTARLLVYILAQ